jgi:thymidylate kinase
MPSSKVDAPIPALVSLCGLDGSGKTTQTKVLQKRLQMAGYKVYYFHSISFSIATKIAQLLGRKKKQNSGESVTSASFLTILLRKIFLKIDLIRFRRLRQELRGKYDLILSDRYYYDTIVNLLYLEEIKIPDDNLHKHLPKTFLETHIPVPDLAFMMNIAPEKIMERENPPEQGIEYLHAKNRIYLKKAQDWNLQLINADNNKEKISQELYKEIKYLLDSRQ